MSDGTIYVWTIGYSYSMNGTNIFIGNSVNNVSGGAIVEIANTPMGFNGASHFSHNFARNEGGAVLIANSALLNFTGTNNINNYANYGGVIFAAVNTLLSFAATIAASTATLQFKVERFLQILMAN